MADLRFIESFLIFKLTLYVKVYCFVGGQDVLDIVARLADVVTRVGPVRPAHQHLASPLDNKQTIKVCCSNFKASARRSKAPIDT